MKLLNRHSIAVVGLMLALAAPSTSMAKDNVRIHLPGISINVGDHRGYYHKKRRHKNHYRSNRYRDSYRGYKRKYRRDHRYDYYSRDYRPRDYRYKKRRYERRNYNNYYYGGSNYYPRQRYYNRSRRVEICPVAGFSLYIDNSRSCYEHKDHYHCD